MAVIGDAFIQIKPETSDFEAEAERGVGGALKGIATKAAVAAGAFVAFGQGANFLKGAVTQASDLGESLSKINVVFGDSAASVIEFTEGAAEGLGQTQAQAAEAVGTFGNLLRAVGLNSDQAATFSKDMVGLAGDLASFNNADPTEVLEALRSGLVGEAEPLKKFGVNINAARIEAKALELGLVGVDGAMTDAAKTQATYALIMEDTKLAQGDFARTSGGLANQQRILSARFGDLQAKIGSAFLPIVTKVVSFLAGPGIAAFESIARTVGNVAQAIGGALGPIFRTLADQVGLFVNALRSGFTEDEGTPIERFALRLREFLGGAFEFITGTVIPAFRTALDGIRQGVGSFIDGLQGRGGEGSFFVDLGEAVRTVYDAVSSFLPRVIEVVGNLFDSLRENRGLAIGLGVALAALLSPVTVLVGGFILLYQRSEAFREGVAGVVGAIQTAIGAIDEIAAAIASFLAPAIEFLSEQIGELVVFFAENWEQMRQAVENAVTGIAIVIGIVLAPIIIFFRSWGDEILAILTVVWEQIRNVITTAVDLIKGVITLVMALLTGEWGQAWNAILGIVSTIWSFITETIENAVQIMLNIVKGVLGGLLDLWKTGWGLVLGALDGIVSGITSKVSGMVSDVIGYFAGIPGQLLGLVGGIASAAGSIGSAIVDGLKGALSGAVGFAGDIANALRRAINNTVLIPLRNALTFTIDIPGPFGSFTVNGGSLIPLLAKGGISMGPTLAMFGEAGREAVLPLPPGLLEGLTALARDRIVGNPGVAGGGVTLSVVNHFPNVTDASSARDIGRAVDENLATGALLRRLELGARS